VTDRFRRHAGAPLDNIEDANGTRGAAFLFALRRFSAIEKLTRTGDLIPKKSINGDQKYQFGGQTWKSG
jgi:hypothetical protein